MTIAGDGARSTFARAVATFATVGAGLGLAGRAFLARMSGDGGLFGDLVTGGLAFLVVTVALLAGPLAAALVGIGSDGSSPAASAAGSLVGFPIMMALVIFLLGLFGGGTGGETLGDWIGTITLVSIPTALVAGTTSALGGRFGRES